MALWSWDRYAFGTPRSLAQLPILSIALCLVLFLAPGLLRAQEKVVLELFTSQGCSSCPPANALLERLGRQPGVLALALHVSYWDYLGWKDSFATPQSTARQKAYARARGARSLYTPQMLVQRTDALVGHDADAIQRSIELQPALPVRVLLEVSREAETMRIKLTPKAVLRGPLDVQVVRYTPKASVTVLAGENAGKEIASTNIVTDWDTVAHWDGIVPVELQCESLFGADAVAVIIQEAGAGAILAAATLP